MPSFHHSFEDQTGTITAGTIDLGVREIEDAGVLEILQTPGAALGNWQFLDALLDPASSSFSFLEPLGHAREVKTAVSGLFGRFVARAYASRYLGLTHFVHVRKPPMTLGGMLRGTLQRVPRRRGDMPDWVAWGPNAGMAIVEAKGCHDSKGPDAALARAFAQAERAEIRIRGRRVPFKRYAIATRWGFTNPKVSAPMLWVKDPEEEGEYHEGEAEALEIAMARWHAATLLAPLGHASLAKPLFALAQEPFRNRVEGAQAAAREALSAIAPVRVSRADAAPEDLLIGGLVTRAGPLGPAALDGDASELLQRAGLRPAFVGIERGELKRAIEGVAHLGTFIQEGAKFARERRQGEDGAGSWVIRLEEDAAQIAPLAL